MIRYAVSSVDSGDCPIKKWGLFIEICSCHPQSTEVVLATWSLNHVSAS
jgi:hypothetical protein